MSACPSHTSCTEGAERERHPRHEGGAKTSRRRLGAAFLFSLIATLGCSRSVVILAPGDGEGRSHEVDLRVPQGSQTQVELACTAPGQAQKVIVSWKSGLSFGGKKVHVSYWCAVDEHEPGGLE